MIKDIYRVAGADITDQRDCNVYLIDAGSDAILIDAGFGAALDRTDCRHPGRGRIPRLRLAHHPHPLPSRPHQRRRCPARAARLPPRHARAGRGHRGGRGQPPHRRLLLRRGLPAAPYRRARMRRGGQDPLRRRRRFFHPYPRPHARLHRALYRGRRQEGALRPGHSRAAPPGLRLRHGRLARIHGEAPRPRCGRPMPTAIPASTSRPAPSPPTSATSSVKTGTRGQRASKPVTKGGFA